MRNGALALLGEYEQSILVGIEHLFNTFEENLTKSGQTAFQDIKTGLARPTTGAI